MDATNATLLSILATIVAYLLYQAWKINQFWKDRGVPYPKPLLLFGNTFPLLTGKLGPGKLHKNLLNLFPNEPFIGIYEFTKPVLLLNNIQIIEKVIVKDFIHFTDHGLLLDEQRNPLHSHLFAMSGKRWKAVRNKLSPIFTTAKLKIMYDTMGDCGNELIKQMEQIDENIVTDMKDIVTRFVLDTIGSTIFGIDPGNLVKPENEFNKMAKKAVNFDTLSFLKLLILIHFPTLTKLFNITLTNQESVTYFSKIMKQTLNYRREKGIKRKDLIQLLMQLQDKGYIEIKTFDAADDYLNIDTNYTSEKFELTDEQLTGHAVSFLTSGFDVVAVTITFTLYELAKHAEIQEHVRNEILREINHAGSLSYDALKDMTFLERCIKETLRKYPPVQILIRTCTKEYTFPNGLTIQPGQSILIPIVAIHYNPKYYPEPEKFKPERFERRKTVPRYAFLPFGNGPRTCIAKRYALLKMKHCLAKLLINYNFELSPKTKEPIRLSNRDFFTTPKDVIYFNVKKIDNTYR